MTNHSVQHPLRVAFLLTLVVCIVLLLASAVAAETPETGGEAVASTTHVVVSGDTLWDIASRHTDAGGDVRRTIFDIQRASGLEGSQLFPGQVLRIPAG